MDFQQIVAAFQERFPELTETQAVSLTHQVLPHINECSDEGDGIVLLDDPEPSNVIALVSENEGVFELTVALDPNEPPPE